MNNSNTLNHNFEDFRGFDPRQVTNPNDPFPDTSQPIGPVNNTSFGNGVPGGVSSFPIEETLGVSVLEMGFPQSTTQSLLSGPGPIPGQRVNHIEFGFDQSVEEQGQIFNIFFSIDSITDFEGNLIGQARGSFTQVVSDPVSTQGVIRTCSGSFTFDDVSNFTLTNGPSQQC